MAVPKKRVSSSRRNMRRSHHALKEKVLATCECGAPRMSHIACQSCGRYNGRVVIDVAQKAQAKAARKAKREKGETR